MNYQLLFAYLLILSLRKRPYLTCQDLSLLGVYTQDYCCHDCHRLEVKEGPAQALIHDGFRGHDALLCCHASKLLAGEQRMPCHSEDYPV